MVDPVEFERRYKARIVELLLRPLSAEELSEAQERAAAQGMEFEPWTPEEAQRWAEDNWLAINFEEHSEGFMNDPEGAADEEMSNWSD